MANQPRAAYAHVAPIIMKVIHLSYAHITQYNDPGAWLKKINFFVLLLEKLSTLADVKSVHCIRYSGILIKNNVEYHFVKLNGLQLLFPFLLNNYVQRLHPDIIIVHGFHFPV